jgi:PAS domain S-box-containing protein
LCAIFGLTREQLLRKTFQEISFPEDLPRCLALTAQLAQGAIPRYTVEKRFQRANGSFVYTRVIVTAVRTAGGAPEFFLGIVEDLSEQWAAEKARRGAEERLRVALDASGTGIYRYDFATESLEWSNGLAAVMGLADGDTLHSLERLLGVIHPDDLPQVLAAYQRSATEGADFDEEFRIVWPDGSIRWICDRARMTLDGNGKPRYLTGACVDVTKRRQAEEERRALLARERHARAEAERAMKLRDETLAIVAHDLRNPVHTIMMSAGAAIELPLSPADHALQLTLIRRSARGMDALIQDLLDATRLETGRLTIQPAPTALDSIIDDAVTGSATRARERAVRLETDVPPGLPTVHVDRGRIVQVFTNLLGNAIKFTPSGGRIVVRARASEGCVECAVEDTGIGIDPSNLPRVFERYWQAERGSGHGVGLGLAIVRGIIDAHGGTIDISSAPGTGTTIRFTLPVA